MTIKTSEGNITASKAVLNMLSIHLFESAEKHEKENFKALAKQARTIATELYKGLEETGFYK